jgi:hypothetical protein
MDDRDRYYISHRYDAINSDREAVEQSDGSYLNVYGITTWYDEAGQLHKDDGPAIILPDGSVNWYLHGLQYDSFNAWLIKLNKSDETKMMLRLQYA